MREMEEIALAALLHDIGKFYQRAKQKDDSIKQRHNETNNKDFFVKEHAYYSYLWIKEKESILKNVFEGLDIENLANLASKHHKNFKDLNPKEIIIKFADWFSSAERERILEDETNILHCIFERVSFIKEAKEENDLKNFAYYKLRPLKLDENIFPIIKEGVYKGFRVKHSGKSELEKELKNDYSKLFEEFEKDFEKIKNFKDNQGLNFIYYLLQKYTWCVPASIYDSDRKSRHYPDISLFDHSRVLAMIATSLYDYWKETNIYLDFNDLKQKNFLLMIEGDIGGIQKFIYNIGKTQGIEGFSVSKALRGRSFIVSMIPELISRHILKELNYPITNILYVGGGKFQLIIGNTQNNIQRLKEIENKLNKFMFEKFYGELSLSLVYKEFSGNYLLGEEKFFSDLIDEVQILLDEKKKRKFGEILAKEYLENSKSICKSCKTAPAEKDICTLCEISNKVGDKIPKINFLVFGNKVNEKYIEILNLEEFGAVYGIDRIEEELVAEEILAINNTDFFRNNGFKFIGNLIPIVDKEDIDIFKKITSEEETNDELKEGAVLPFKVLSKLSDGDEKLGVFRADVDNLGLIFSEGLRKKDKYDANRYTISRIATLSRMLDLFFSGYINILAKEVSQEEKVKIKDKEGNKVDLKIQSLIYTVYSGGDDIFIIAPYNVAIKFALKLREKFYEYTARNLDFGLSGGILISTSTMPIKLMAEFAENLENKSKKVFYIRNKKDGNNNEFKETKDSISIFTKTYRWKKFQGIKSIDILNSSTIPECSEERELTENKLIYLEDIIQIVEDILKHSKHISRGFLFRLLELYNIYIAKNNKTISRAGIFPHLYYQIVRNIKEEDVKIFLENLLLIKGYIKNGKVIISRDDVIENLDTIVSLVLMKTRGGS